jgi:hypothetical protein
LVDYAQRILNSAEAAEAESPEALRRGLFIGRYYGDDSAPRRAQERASFVLNAWTPILPTRIVNEDIGDYIEDIHFRAGRERRGVSTCGSLPRCSGPLSTLSATP